MKKIISILLLSVVAWSMVWADDNPLYNIVCKQNDRGIVTTSPVRQAHQFDKVTLNAVPYEGYKLYRFVIRLLPGETTIPSGSNIQGEHYFYMPNNDVEVSADFVPADYNIFIDQKPEGTIVTNPSGKAEYGSIVTVTFTLNDSVTDYNISNVKVDLATSGGFNDDEPWGPALAPPHYPKEDDNSENSDNSVEVTQTGFNTFTFVMPLSDVLITPVIEKMQKVSLRKLAASGEEGKLYIIRDSDIAVGYYDATTGIIYAKDSNHADEQEIPESAIDYVTQTGLQQAAWDHSNWLAIDLFNKTDPNMPNYEKEKMIRNIRGKLVDATNLQMMVAENPYIPTDGDEEFSLLVSTNNFIPANYYGTQEGTDGNNYFFIAPAPNEYNYIHWAVWNADNGTFTMPLDSAANSLGLQGSFPATFASGFDATTLIDGESYTIEGISKIMKNEETGEEQPRLASDEFYSVFVINATQTEIVPPAIPGDVNGDGFVTSVDVTVLYNYMLNGDDSDMVNGDQNGDGSITSNDVTFVYNILLGN
ncbi:MAG: hypothetical protein J5629_00610 [Muribaculaceae bacterium]|nr:hypothetical protein [Muribaculaceae bacterium]